MKKIFCLYLIILMVLLTNNVYAEEIHDYMLKKFDVVPGVFVTKKKENHEIYDYMYIIARKSNNQFVYCLTPGIHVDENAEYSGNTANLDVISGLSKDKIEKIKLIAYFGYGYVNQNKGIDHSDKKWYAVTQYMIWQVDSNGYDIYFTDYLQGPKVEKFENEINEINLLIDNYYKRVKLINFVNHMDLNRVYSFNDENNVLSDYKVEMSNDKAKATIIGNRLDINPVKIGNSNITIYKQFNIYNNNPIVFVADNSQTLFEPGNLLDIQIKYNITIDDSKVKARLKLINIDENSNNIINLNGVKFKLFDVDNNKEICQSDNSRICEYVTTNGVLLFPEELSEGHYKIIQCEDQLIDGYTWNSEEIEFIIDKDTVLLENNIVEVRFPNKRVMGKIILKKYGEIFNNNNYEMVLLNNIGFEIYANNDIYLNDGTLVYKKDELVTDFVTKNGQAIIPHLELGSYRIVEKDISNQYILSDPYYVEFKYLDQYTGEITTNVRINNEMIKANLKITKIDIDTNVGIEGTKFGVYDLNSNLLFHGTTDKNGILLVKNIPYGKYYFKEIQSTNGYVNDEKIYYFNINKNNDTLNFTVGNKKTTNNLVVKVPNTLSNSYNYLFVPLLFLIIKTLYDKKYY